MSCPCSDELANIYAAINTLESEFNYLTGNVLSNYNQITRIVAQQGNIYNTVYYGLGNLNTGNLTVSNDYNISNVLNCGNLTVNSANLNTYGYSFYSNGYVHIGINDTIDYNKYGLLTLCTKDSDNTSSISLVRQNSYVWKMGFANDGTNDYYIFDGTNGVKLTAGNNQSWSTISDRRFKKNITFINNCFDKIDSINGVYYNFNYENDDAPRKVGLIAQEVESILPEVVDQPISEEKAKSVRYSEIIPFLVNCIKELKNQNKELQNRVNNLESSVNELKNKNNKINFL